MLVGNKKVKDLLDNIIKSENKSHAYLFVGPKNVGKTTFAKYLASGMLCNQDLGPCGNCVDCQVFSAGNHPDFYLFDGEKTITVDEARELIGFLDLKPYQAKNKVVILSHAERMTTSAANSFLKTLEEPTINTIIILTAENVDSLLPTIVSRTQVIKFIKEDEDIASSDVVQIITNGKPGLKELFKDDEYSNKITMTIHEFVKLIDEGSILEKVKFAEKISKEKEIFFELVEYLEALYRYKLINEGGKELKNTKILDKLSETKDFVSKNVNLQLAMESLMFIGLEND